MGLLSWLRGDGIDLGVGQAENRSLGRDTLPIDVWHAWAPTGRPLTHIGPHNATAVATAWACIKLLADSISTLPLRVYRRMPDGTRQPAGPDQRLAQLLARPWPGATGVDLISQMVVHYLLHGEVWVGKYTSEGSIVSLGVIHPDRMQIFVRGARVIYALDGDQSYGPEDIVYIRGLVDPLFGLRGMSPIAQTRSAFELNESLRESSRQFFREGSRPSGILTVSEDASQEGIHQIRENWRNLYSGAGGPQNMHRVAVLTGDMSFTPVTMSLSDQEFLSSREFSVREIAAIFGLPAWAINGSSGDSLTYSNTAEQARFLVQHSFRPITARIETALSADPSLCPGGAYCAFDFSELLKGSPNERAQFYTAALNPQTGWLTREEVRDMEDLAPEGGADYE